MIGTGMMGQGMGHPGYGYILWILLLFLAGLGVYYAAKKEGGVKFRGKELMAAGGAVLLVLLLGGGVMGVGMGMGLVFWALIIILVYYLVAGRGTFGGMPPQELLDMRYAKGDISREEYLRMKEEIGKR